MNINVNKLDKMMDGKDLYIEKIRKKRYLGVAVISADAYCVGGLTVPKDYTLSNETVGIVADTIKKLEENPDRYEFYISEIKSRGDKSYLATITFVDGQAKVSNNRDDKNLLSLAHKPLNSAEKIDKISSYLRYTDSAIDPCIEFLRENKNA